MDLSPLFYSQLGLTGEVSRASARIWAPDQTFPSYVNVFKKS